MGFLTANIVARNEQDRIGACIAALAVCDEIIVVDQQSTDNTATIARHAGATVIFDVHHGYGDPSRPLAEEASTGEWILTVDCDELLRESGLLPATLKRAKADSFRLTRHNQIGGQHLSTETHIRIWRKGTQQWPDHWRPHLRLTPAGTVHYLRYPIIDHDKTWQEQLDDDETYERLGCGTGPLLAYTRKTGMTGAMLDNMSTIDAQAHGFDVRELTR